MKRRSSIIIAAVVEKYLAEDYNNRRSSRNREDKSAEVDDYVQKSSRLGVEEAKR